MKLMRGLLALLILQVCSAIASAETVNVKFVVVGQGSGQGYTSVPGVGSTTLVVTESQTISVEKGSTVYLQFYAATGYRLALVTDTVNGDTETVFSRTRVITVPTLNITAEDPHTVLIKFEIDSPVGTFPLAYSGAPTSVPITDITGNYTGTIPPFSNPYTMTITMDDSGKTVGMGTVDGFVNSKTDDNTFKGTGAVKTVNGRPTASGTGNVNGTLNNRPVTGSGNATVPVQVTDTGSGKIVDGVVASGKGTQDGKSFSQPPMTFTVPAQTTAVDRNFTINLVLTEVEDAKGKTYVTAEATLIMPTDQRTKFKAKRVKYSLEKGYTVAFAGGTKVNTSGEPLTDAKGKPLIDRKSTLLISKLTLSKGNTGFVPTGGLLKYKLLGQKGQAPVTDFLVAP